MNVFMELDNYNIQIFGFHILNNNFTELVPYIATGLIVVCTLYDNIVSSFVWLEKLATANHLHDTPIKQ